MLELAHERLYWPEPSQIWHPSGSGPKVYSQLASEKIGEKIKRKFPDDARGLDVSVLAANPEGDETEAPIAIVCQFSKTVTPEVIKETHRLAWSFSRARSLITIEPHLLRVWSCCEPPATQDASTQEGQQVLNLDSRGILDPVCRITEEDLDLVSQASKALQWVELVSGQFFQKPEYENRFKKSGAADQMLLENLKEVRQQLHDDGLDYETIHDLLARLIFIQFLFQKQDSEGRHALSETLLQDWHNQGILSKSYKRLPEILDSFDDTYSLFRCLNTKFNGDLFPGKGETEEECEREWQSEIKKVRAEDNRYLIKLAQFVRGNLRMQDGQLSLWPYYSFDVIPLDFISSIYEEFVRQPEKKAKKEGKPKKQRKSRNAKDSVHYTPEYIVDFILDGVLPWNDKDWDLKILDPACGSGIFLVKAFQRLIYRWELAHDGQGISADVLRTLLENNIFGVDIDGEAVRVASFSLYLTMLDCIDPLEYWENDVRFFPRLRKRRLIAADFFREDKEGFRTTTDAGTYDLVLGNAPWGKNSVKLSTYAEAWQARPENHEKWKISYGNIGLLFLPKAAALTKQGGTVAMMQPAMPLLFNQSGPAKEFRYQLFSEFKVEEIVNLSALRFGLFRDAISPTCIITFRNLQPNNEPLTYICPKPELSDEDNYRLAIEPQNISFVYRGEAQSAPYIWATLMWGGRRDVSFIKSLIRLPNLKSLNEKGVLIKREGIIRGDRKKEQLEILGRPILENPDFPNDIFLLLNPSILPINSDPKTHSRESTDLSAFALPQIIIKQSWKKRDKRFQAVIVNSEKEPVLCSQSYLTVHASKQHSENLKAICLTVISKLAVYYLLLSSGRFASFIPELTVDDLMQLPIPEDSGVVIKNIENIDENEVDERIYNAFLIKESERVLIEDLFDYTLPDFKGNLSSPGRQRTNRKNKDFLEPDLTQYCEYFMRVIRAGFGQDKEICATIFREPTNHHLPVRLVAIYLNRAIHDGIKLETINSQDLLDLLSQLNKQFMEQRDSGTGGIFYQRVARVYASTPFEGKQVPTVYLIKPDKIRYWTCSMALRDADEVVADIMVSSRDTVCNA